VPGEALFCYFKRLFEEGYPEVTEGDQGDPGPAGTEQGFNGWTEIEIAFSRPTGSEAFVFTITDAIQYAAPGHVLFVEGLGWVQVFSIIGTDIVSAGVIQYIDDPLDTIPIGALVVPTGPGGIDGGSVLTVATPTFEPVGGNYEFPIEVAIECQTAGANIYYTVDGSDPDELSTSYAGPVEVTEPTTLKAKAYLTGYVASEIGEAQYDDELGSVGFWGSYFDTSIDDTVWESVFDTFGSSDPTTYAYVADGEVYQYYIAISDGSVLPKEVNGFVKDGVPLAVSDFAGAAEGYSDVDDHGWPCQRIQWEFPGDGFFYNVYRLKEPQAADFSLKVNFSVVV